MAKQLSIIKDLLRNRLRLCEFAVTNMCTAQCQFCSIWKQKDKIRVDTEKALQTISHLATLGVRFITLTGGEPLLHPDFDKLVERCTQEDIISAVLAADSRLFTERRLDALERSKADLVCISVDSHEERIAYESRKIPDTLARTRRAVEELSRRKIKTMASTLICDFNYNALRELFQSCVDMGFDFITVNYPEFSQSPVYTLGGDAITLSKEHLIDRLMEVMELKKEFPQIVNPVNSLENIISYLEDETPEFPCLGGYRVFFIDWFFQAYPCMHLGRSMGDVLELKLSDFKKEPCNQCNMSWYRDFSVYFQGLKSIRPLLSGLQFVFSDVL